VGACGHTLCRLRHKLPQAAELHQIVLAVTTGSDGSHLCDHMEIPCFPASTFFLDLHPRAISPFPTPLAAIITQLWR
jgi:hypothetical protein